MRKQARDVASIVTFESYDVETGQLVPGDIMTLPEEILGIAWMIWHDEGAKIASLSRLKKMAWAEFYRELQNDFESEPMESASVKVGYKADYLIAHTRYRRRNVTLDLVIEKHEPTKAIGGLDVRLLDPFPKDITDCLAEGLTNQNLIAERIGKSQPYVAKILREIRTALAPLEETILPKKTIRPNMKAYGDREEFFARTLNENAKQARDMVFQSRIRFDQMRYANEQLKILES